MDGIDRRVARLASTQRFLISRAEVLDLGGSDEVIETRLRRGAWERLQAGVYQIDRRTPDWETNLLAAVLACGPEARASHRAALILWGLDGLRRAPLEVTMPFGNLGQPEGVIVHRTRRPTVRSEQSGIPVSGPERTLLECAGCLPPIVIAKALDSAIRASLTTTRQVRLMLAAEGGRGIRGTRRLRLVLSHRVHDEATDSGGEFELLYHMQQAELPRPELGFELFPASGRRVPDFFWPALGKSVEVDGVDAHNSADKLDDDLERQNEIMDLGYQIRRFTARQIRRNPQRVVEQIRRFLES